MATVKIDIVDGAGVSFSDRGYETDRIATVSGLSGSTPSAVLYNALQQPDLPNYGSPHPNIPYIRVVNISASADGPQQARIVYHYGLPQFGTDSGTTPDDPPTIEVGATLVEVETQRDADGNVMYLQPHNPDNPGENDGPQVVATTRKMVARPFIKYQRKTTDAPDNRAKDYVGTVNDGNFAGFGEGQWLCTEIVGRSSDAGVTWTENLEFLLADQDNLKPDGTGASAGWDSVLIAVKDGVPQVNPENDKAIKVFKTYDRKDFGNLF